MADRCMSQARVSTSDDPFAFSRNTLWCSESGYGGIPGVIVPLMPKPDTKFIQCPWPRDFDVTVAGDLSTIIMTTDTPLSRFFRKFFTYSTARSASSGRSGDLRDLSRKRASIHSHAAKISKCPMGNRLSYTDTIPSQMWEDRVCR